MKNISENGDADARERRGCGTYVTTKTAKHARLGDTLKSGKAQYGAE